MPASLPSVPNATTMAAVANLLKQSISILLLCPAKISFRAEQVIFVIELRFDV